MKLKIEISGGDLSALFSCLRKLTMDASDNLREKRIDFHVSGHFGDNTDYSYDITNDDGSVIKGEKK
jgi:hypothetical protein